MVKNEETGKIIKVPVRLIIVFVFLIIIFFLFAISHENRKFREIKKATYESEINPTDINGNEMFGDLRGALFYKKGSYISTSAVLVENREGFNSWKSDVPIIDFNNRPHRYTLDDLGLPFTVSKRSDCDTIIIIKDGKVLKFMIVD